MRLEAVPDHVAETLAVIALDVLENIRLVAASDRPIEPLVLVEGREGEGGLRSTMRHGATLPSVG